MGDLETGTATYGEAARPSLSFLADRIYTDGGAVKRGMLGAHGREGARLEGLSATQTDELQRVGVLGRGEGLTSRGVALRAILQNRQMDEMFGSGSGRAL